MSELEHAQQRMGSAHFFRSVRIARTLLLGEDRLNALESVVVDEGLVLAVVEFPGAAALADVAGIFKERLHHAGGPTLAGFAFDVLCVEVGGEAFGGLRADEAGEDHTDVVRGLDARDELVIDEIVAIGDASAHEHAEPERGADLVADAVADHLALELRERGEDVHDHASGGVRGVELLGDGDKGDFVLLEDVVELREVRKRAREAVDLVHDHDIDLAVFDVLNHLLERRAVRVASGESAVAVFFLETPAVRGLRFDVGERGVALGVE